MLKDLNPIRRVDDAYMIEIISKLTASLWSEERNLALGKPVDKKKYRKAKKKLANEIHAIFGRSFKEMDFTGKEKDKVVSSSEIDVNKKGHNSNLLKNMPKLILKDILSYKDEKRRIIAISRWCDIMEILIQKGNVPGLLAIYNMLTETRLDRLKRTVFSPEVKKRLESVEKMKFDKQPTHEKLVEKYEKSKDKKGHTKIDPPIPDMSLYAIEFNMIDTITERAKSDRKAEQIEAAIQLNPELENKRLELLKDKAGLKKKEAELPEEDEYHRLIITSQIAEKVEEIKVIEIEALEGSNPEEYNATSIKKIYNLYLTIEEQNARFEQRSNRLKSLQDEINIYPFSLIDEEDYNALVADPIDKELPSKTSGGSGYSDVEDNLHLDIISIERKIKEIEIDLEEYKDKFESYGKKYVALLEKMNKKSSEYIILSKRQNIVNSIFSKTQSLLAEIDFDDESKLATFREKLESLKAALEEYKEDKSLVTHISKFKEFFDVKHSLLDLINDFDEGLDSRINNFIVGAGLEEKKFDYFHHCTEIKNKERMKEKAPLTPRQWFKQKIESPIDSIPASREFHDKAVHPRRKESDAASGRSSTRDRSVSVSPASIEAHKTRISSGKIQRLPSREITKPENTTRLRSKSDPSPTFFASPKDPDAIVQGETRRRSESNEDDKGKTPIRSNP